MSRTITALFDTRADAEAGKERLKAARLDADHVHIHSQESTGGSDRPYSTHQDVGMWESIKNAFLPDEDRHTYEEGVRRGGFLLTADVDDDQVDEAVRALEDANTVDIDERANQWRSQGWAYGAGNAGDTSGRSAMGGNTDRTDRQGEQHIDVVEEQLVVGKREVDRGGVRVRSYVTETPVHEQIRLRNERVNVERRPVDRAVTGGDDAFRERSFEVTETGEEAVVGKTQRVVEEVVVGKTVDERVEQIDDTVRRTDVDVEQLSGTERTGAGTTGMAGSSGMGTPGAGTTGMADRTGSTGGATTGAGAGGASFGDKAAGLGKEALGNAKQGIGGMTGNDSLKQSGMAQERAGEQQQGKGPDRD